jgi:uncharacterized protein (DUF433 family)
MRREIGRHIVIDPEIHHGAMTFWGTRIPIAYVLDDVAEGTDWETVVEQWHGSVTPEAISEAIRLAVDALLAEHGQPRRSESAPA